MRQWLWCIVLMELGLACIGLGFLVPAHLRAVDAAQVKRAGLRGASLAEEALELVRTGRLGPAQWFAEAAEAAQAPDREKLAAGVKSFAAAQPRWVLFGGEDPWLSSLFAAEVAQRRTDSPAIFDWLEDKDKRVRLWERLQATRKAVVLEALKARNLTNTVYFSPAATVSGHSLESMIALTGLLFEQERLTPALQDKAIALLLEANRSGQSERLEAFLLDLMSLGKRMNWGQLVAFLGRIEDPLPLSRLARAIRAQEGQTPAIFTAVVLSGQPAEVAQYLWTYPKTGLTDLTFALGQGAGGLKEVLRRQHQVHYPWWIREKVLAYEPFGTLFDMAVIGSLGASWAALLLKYLCFLGGGFLLARGWQWVRPAASPLEAPLAVPALVPARQGLWSICFLLGLILLCEPHLAQETQRVEAPPRASSPAKAPPAAPAESATHSFMDHLTLLSLVLFFVLQAMIYTVCLLKLAEIRRQVAAPQLKLKLLENEDHLFDAGLYLGFVGTIISLILMSMGVVKFSLMAGYSSTSFGIIFVCVLKVFHIRPLRRQLILESAASQP